jgi:endonuclease/exonuclease/phosphatase family metal-dependent hydrolase
VRQLVFSSYNIHRGLGLDRRLDLDRTAAVIAEMSPDVIGLQEVIRQDGDAHQDQAAYLASRLGMELVMGVARPYRGGTYGNAVLTRLPVLGWAACDLSHGSREPRACLRVDLDIEGRPLHVFNCHFGLALRERRQQVNLLARFIRDITALAGPRVVMGDFNEWHPGPVSRKLRREFSSPMRRMRRTHPSVFPLFALDRLYWDVELEGRDFHVHVSRLARVASDHLPIVATLRVRQPASPRVPKPYVEGEALPPSE